MSDDSGFDAEVASFETYSQVAQNAEKAAPATAPGPPTPGSGAAPDRRAAGEGGYDAEREQEATQRYYDARMRVLRGEPSGTPWDDVPFRDSGAPHGASDPISSWDAPPGFTAEDAANAMSGLATPADATPTSREAAAYNEFAAYNLGVQDRAGMDSVEAFESQAAMYQQIDEDE